MSRLIRLPFDPKELAQLRAGDRVLLHGPLLTARDAAHRRMVQALERGEELPVSLRGETIYYVGPCPARPGEVIGSAGPTTSSRMDPYTKPLLDQGLLAMVGKGGRSAQVVQEIQKAGAVYLVTLGGAGALLSQRIRSAQVLAYAELGAEAIYRFEVSDFPAFVAIDSHGGNILETGRNAYRRN